MSRRHPHGRAYPGAAPTAGKPSGMTPEFIGQLALRLKPGTVTMLEYRHDADCPLLAGRGPCTCNPEVAIVPLDPAPEAKA